VSVVCELDLKGFDAELRVLSGRKRNVGIMHEVIDRMGSDPGKWLPVFLTETDKVQA